MVINRVQSAPDLMSAFGTERTVQPVTRGYCCLVFNSVPSAASSFGDLVYGMLPHPKITEMLDEVDDWTGFTRHFTHLKNNHVKPKNRK